MVGSKTVTLAGTVEVTVNETVSPIVALPGVTVLVVCGVTTEIVLEVVFV